MKKILTIFIAILIMVPASYAAEVKNLRSTQVGNRVLFEYDLKGEEEESDVSVSLTINGKTYEAKDLHLEDDYGKVETGENRKIYWNVLQDFPRGYSGDLDVEINAGGTNYTDPVTGMEMVYVKGGCYQMGDLWGEGDDDEKPVHEVCLNDFYIGKYEVTQGQWKEIMGNNPSHFSSCGDNCPVEKVSWNDVQKFIKRLNELSGRGASRTAPITYRLPTEAEWEYAARSGGKRERSAGTNNESSLGEYTWYRGNSGGRTHPVGQKRPNGLGINDMSGNVWEWIGDWYDKDYYNNSPKWNPKGINNGKYRVLRGGCWHYGPRNVRTADRYWSSPDNWYHHVGFRLLGTP